MTTLISVKSSNVLVHILGFIHTLLALSSIGLMITNSAFTWASNCANAEGHFYHMVSTMYIVMWSLMGSYFIIAILCTLISKAIDIRRSAATETSYVALASE
jgi:hypothetical protein